MWNIKKKKHKSRSKKEDANLFFIILLAAVFVLVMIKRNHLLYPTGVIKKMQKPLKLLKGVRDHLRSRTFLRPSPSEVSNLPRPDFRPSCAKNEFRITNMTSCHEILYCDAIFHNVDKGSYFNKGKTKKMQFGVWEGHRVAVAHSIASKVINSKEDFNEHISNLVRLQSPFVTQLIGFCNVSKTAFDYAKSFIVTEYHQRGSLDTYLNSNKHIKSDATERLRLAVSYLKTLNFLHNQTEGSLVVCDSNDLKGALQNYLVTSDRRVILNDMDDLPLVNRFGKLIQCKHQDVLSGQPSIVGENFLAPEQKTALLASFPNSAIARLERHSGVTSTGAEIDAQGRPPPSLDAKIDVYKIPDIVQAILLINKEKLSKLHSDSYRKASLNIWRKLMKINEECKDPSPNTRPQTSKVLQVYENLLKSLSS
ncbi:protein O-mannose kinase [Ciona intestinalis]